MSPEKPLKNSKGSLVNWAYLVQLKSHSQFYILLALWVITAWISPLISFGLVTLSILLFFNQSKWSYLIVGLWVCLIFSDSRLPQLAHFANVKIVYVVGLLILTVLAARKFNYKHPFIDLFLPFITIGAIAIFKSDAMFTSLQKWLSYAAILLIVPIWFEMAFRKYGYQVIRLAVYTFLTIVIAGLLLSLAGSDIVQLAGRYRGLLGNPNGQGIISFLFWIFFRVVVIRFPKLFEKREVNFIYVVVLASVLYTQSRTAILSIAAFEMFVWMARFNLWVSIFSFLVLVFSYESLLSYAPVLIRDLGLGDFFRLDTLEEASGRQIGWAFAWENIQKNFFLGKGFAHTELLYAKNYSFLAIRGHQGNAHNSLLTIWLDTGLVGLVFFLFGWIGSAIRAAKQDAVAIPVLFVVLFSVNFESWLAASLNPFTIVVVMTFSVLMLDDKSLANPALESNEDEQ